MNQPDLFATNSAVISPCRKYRYILKRSWDESKGFVNFIGLNPSTADESKDDPTIRRCMGFARDWGYGGIYMTNLFALRATHPEELKKTDDDLHDARNPYNSFHLHFAIDRSKITIAAWGNHGKLDSMDYYMKSSHELHYLKMNSTGQPAHPLYLPKTLKPIKWDNGAKVVKDLLSMKKEYKGYKVADLKQFADEDIDFPIKIIPNKP